MAAPLPGPGLILVRPLPNVPARAWGDTLHEVVVATFTARDIVLVAPQGRIFPGHQRMGRTLVPPRPIATEQPPARGVLSMGVNGRAAVVTAGTRSVAERWPLSPVRGARRGARYWKRMNTRGISRGRVKRTRWLFALIPTRGAVAADASTDTSHDHEGQEERERAQVQGLEAQTAKSNGDASSSQVHRHMSGPSNGCPSSCKLS